MKQRLDLEYIAYVLSWSPDGELIVFRDESSLFIIDADRGDLRQVSLPKTDQGRTLDKPVWRGFRIRCDLGELSGLPPTS